MNLSEFVKKYNGKKVDWDGAYSGQCTDLFRQYCNDVLNINQPMGIVGAKDFWSNYDKDPALKDNFTKHPNTRSLIAKEGDVVIWGTGVGKYGHVAIAIEGAVSKFSSFDQNWKTLSVCEVIKHDYKSVLGVLRPKKSLKTDCMPLGTLSDDDKEFIERKGYKDVNDIVDACQSYRNEREEALKSLEELEEALKSCKEVSEEIQDTLEKQLSTNRDLLEKYRRDLAQANLRISSLEKKESEYKQIELNNARLLANNQELTKKLRMKVEEMKKEDAKELVSALIKRFGLLGLIKILIK